MPYITNEISRYYELKNMLYNEDGSLKEGNHKKRELYEYRYLKAFFKKDFAKALYWEGFLEGWDKKESLQENTNNLVDNNEFIFCLDYLYKGSMCSFVLVSKTSFTSPYCTVKTNFGEVIVTEVSTFQVIEILNKLQHGVYA